MKYSVNSQKNISNFTLIKQRIEETKKMSRSRKTIKNLTAQDIINDVK